MSRIKSNVCVLDSLLLNKNPNSQSSNMEMSLSKSKKKIKSDLISKPKKNKEVIKKSNNGIHWYPIQSDMFKNAKQEGHEFLVTRDIKKTNNEWVKEFASFDNYQQYLTISKTLSPAERNWCEIIPKDMKCKPVFDLEWYGMDTEDDGDGDGNDSYHYEEIYVMFDAYVRAVFLDLGFNPSSLNILVLESHHHAKPVKYSYHAIVTNYYLKNHSEYGKQLAQLVVDKINADPESPLHLCLGKEDKDGNKGKRSQPLDLTIYTSNRNFRMKDHHKRDEINRDLVPSEGSELPASKDYEYLITVVDDSAVLVDIVLPKSPVVNNRNMTIILPVIGFEEKLKNIQDYLEMIDISEFRYNDWLRIGIALYVELGDEGLGLQLWDDFSKRFNSYNYQEIEKSWRGFSSGNYSEVTIGTLKYYAETTNPKQFLKYIVELASVDLYHELYQKALSNYHDDVADLVLAFLGNNLMTCDGLSRETKLWFYFSGNYWIETDGRANIRQCIKTLVIPYLNLKREQLVSIIKNIEDTEDTEQQKNSLNCECEQIDKLVKCLSTDNYKHSISNIIKFNCYQPDIYQKFDTNINLFGCLNGVYDLENFIFRPGYRNDLITVTTELDYLENDDAGKFGADHPKVIEIEGFFKQIQPNEKVRNYLKLLLGSSLCGRNILEHVYLMTGEGSNGKSKLIELIDYALGKHSASINISYFTGKRPPSNQATPEVESIVNARLVTASEAEQGEQFNIDILKKTSGNDKITSRGLHKPIRQITPKFTLIFAVNHLPKLPADDGAVWRRIRVIKFNSKFVDNPDPNYPNEHLKDPRLNKKLYEWRYAMLWLLIQWHKEFCKSGLKDIDEVLEATNAYQTSQDLVKSWLNENIEVTNDENHWVEVKMIKNILSEHQIYRKQFKKDTEFIEYLQKIYHMCKYFKDQTTVSETERKRNIFKGLKLREFDVLDDHVTVNCLLDKTRSTD